MKIMSMDPFGDSQLGKIMLKFRPIAPKPPAAAGAIIAAVSDRAEAAPIMKRRRAVKKPKKITTAVVVTVERVAEVGAAAAAASVIGKEIKRRLEADASPCFVTDSAGRVTWMNAELRRMALCEKSAAASAAAPEPPPLKVEGVTRGTVPGGECGGFTCVARVRRRGKVVMAVPCDVWRVVEEKLGKWAWRLDVATALGLGCAD